MQTRRGMNSRTRQDRVSVRPGYRWQPARVSKRDTPVTETRVSLGRKTLRWALRKLIKLDFLSKSEDDSKISYFYEHPIQGFLNFSLHWNYLVTLRK